MTNPQGNFANYNLAKKSGGNDHMLDLMRGAMIEAGVRGDIEIIEADDDAFSFVPLQETRLNRTTRRHTRASWGASRAKGRTMRKKRLRRMLRQLGFGDMMARLAQKTTPTPKLPCKKRKCLAKTRRGTPCQAPVVKGRTRCRRHGGMSTGPRTPEGKQHAREALERGLARWRARRAIRLCQTRTTCRRLPSREANGLFAVLPAGQYVRRWQSAQATLMPIRIRPAGTMSCLLETLIDRWDQ